VPKSAHVYHYTVHQRGSLSLVLNLP